MKIALVSWAPFYAGAEVAGLALAEGLREAGHEVLFVVGSEGDLAERLRQAKFLMDVIPTRFTDKWSWWKYRSSRSRLTELLRRERPDLVHSNDLPSHQMASDAARRVGIPRVCHHRWIFDQKAIDWFNKFGAERHLFVSHALKDQLCGQSARLANEPHAVVHDGISLPDCPSTEDRVAARQWLGLPLDRVVAIFVGQIIERKGVADLIRAWSLLGRHAEAAELVIVGDDLECQGAYRRRMEALARELAVPARFVGFQKSVHDWQTAADFAVVPSHAEPLGLVALEAMAHGLPVIAGAVGGLLEVVVAEETGLVVPPRSPEALAGALRRLLADRVTRERFGQAGLRRCEEKFGLATHIEAVVEQYQHVVRSRQGVALG